MVQAWKVLSLSSILATGCFGPSLNEPIVRTQLGANARQLATPASATTRTMAARPVETAEPLDTAVTGTLQFSVRPVNSLYIGGEVEAGAFSREGSNYGGAYGVIGLEGNAGRAVLSLEVAAGRQWLRYDEDAKDVTETVLEPRMRLQVLLNSQVTLGGMFGANGFPEERGWAAGLYLGMYSHPWDGT